MTNDPSLYKKIELPNKKLVFVPEVEDVVIFFNSLIPIIYGILLDPIAAAVVSGISLSITSLVNIASNTQYRNQIIDYLKALTERINVLEKREIEVPADFDLMVKKSLDGVLNTKNKDKISRFLEILISSLKGEIDPAYSTASILNDIDDLSENHILIIRAVIKGEQEKFESEKRDPTSNLSFYSLNEIVRETGIEKKYSSKLISDLISRGIIGEFIYQMRFDGLEAKRYIPSGYAHDFIKYIKDNSHK